MRDIFYTDYRHCLFFIRYKKDNNIITEYIEKFNFDENEYIYMLYNDLLKEYIMYHQNNIMVGLKYITKRFIMI